jgi:aspartyl-tRNA(Asn)/glutamyl-tRNA(Gln) amidotransferase subunit C
MYDIKRYESLTKLSLNESERTLISSYVDLLVNSFDRLDTIDVQGVEPLVTVLDVTNVLREDIAAKHITREELLSNAPEQSDGYFQVPRTID